MLGVLKVKGKETGCRFGASSANFVFTFKYYLYYVLSILCIFVLEYDSVFKADFKQPWITV